MAVQAGSRHDGGRLPGSEEALRATPAPGTGEAYGHGAGQEQDHEARERHGPDPGAEPLDGAAGEAQPGDGQPPADGRIWYVACGDSPVGPLSLGELESRWRAQEISEETLVWRRGMWDWQPLADIAELANFLTDVAGEKIATAGEQQWQPAGAAELSALMSRELEELAPDPEPEAEEPAQWPPAGLPELDGFEHVFTLPWQPTTVRLDPLTVGRPRRSSVSLMLAGAALVFLAAAVLVIGEAWMSRDSRAAPDPVLSPEVQRARQETPPDAPGEPEATEGLAQPGVAPWAAPSAAIEPPVAAPDGAQPAAEQLRAREPRAASTGEPDARRHLAPEPPTRASARPKRPQPPPRARAEEPTPAQRSPASSRSTRAQGLAPLTQAQVLASAKQNAASLVPCLKAARSRNEIVPGNLALVLNWTILPDGGVQEPRLVGPATVLGTSLPACFAEKMSDWRFPPSSGSTTVRNFPVPIRIR